MSLLRSNEDAMEKGAIAPDFLLPNVTGEDISISQFDGKSILIIFMFLQI